MPRFRNSLLCGMAAISSLSPAWAQESAPQELEEIVVEGGADTSGVGPVEGVVAKRTLTGMKTATDVQAIPQSVSVIGREEMDQLGVQKIDEALRYTAGVFAQPFGPDSDTNWMFIRGFQATATGTYMDGLQLFSYAFGGFYIDEFGLERIEVLKGPASVLYGGSNPGGIVNYVSKRPTGEQLRYVETGVNDAGNAYFGFDIGGIAHPAVSYRINGRVAGGDTYSDNQDGWRGFISPSVTWQPDDQTTLTILTNYTRVDENHNGGSFLPYEGTVVDRVVGGVNYGKIRRDANFTEPDVDEYDRHQGALGYEFEHTFANDWTVRSNARFGAANITEVNIYPNGWFSATELDRINFGHDTQVRTFLTDQQIEGTFDTGALQHTLLAGLETKYYNIDQVQSSALFGTTPPIDAFHPVYGAPLTPRVSYLNQDLTQNQVGVYVQDQMRFNEGWIVTLNGRYDHVWTKSHDGPTFYAPSQDSTNRADTGEFSGRAGIAYEFANGVTPYASVATFFNPVIGTDSSGALFVPETGTQYEIGLKYVPTFVDGIFTVSLFDLTRQNVPVADPANVFAQVQTGEMQSRGIELEGKFNVTDSFNLTGSFTAYDIDITEDTDPMVIGKTPFIVPEVMASVWADYTFRDVDGWYDGISFGGGVRYIGSSWADNQNTLKVPSATLVDARLGYDRETWGADLNVTNLFDEDYVASCQTAITCSYGEGRSVKLRAYAKW